MDHDSQYQGRIVALEILMRSVMSNQLISQGKDAKDVSTIAQDFVQSLDDAQFPPSSHAVKQEALKALRDIFKHVEAQLATPATDAAIPKKKRSDRVR
jgi:hypothetical protein